MPERKLRSAKRCTEIFVDELFACRLLNRRFDAAGRAARGGDPTIIDTDVVASLCNDLVSAAIGFSASAPAKAGSRQPKAACLMA
jgi:hypothetical protein